MLALISRIRVQLCTKEVSIQTCGGVHAKIHVKRPSNIKLISRQICVAQGRIRGELAGVSTVTPVAPPYTAYLRNY
jgi:hypothetical protein